MKILFIYPNSGAQVGFNYGVAQLAANLRQAGHKSAFWQLCEDIAPLPDETAFARRIQQEAPDVVAFSIVTNQWAYACKLAHWTRGATTAPIACGGVHALFHPEAILETGLFDYVFRGECEDAFIEFIDRLARRETIADVRNLALIHEGKIRINPVRPLPKLENLPPKAYDLMDFQRLIDAKNGWVGLMASRGCPFSCTYCFNHQMTSIYRHDLDCSFADLGYIRHVPVDELMDEIRRLQTNYRRITMFIFDDDLFTFDKDWVREFCRRYPQVTNLPFVVNAHVGFFDEELAVMLRRAGCRVVKFGLESGSEDLRRRILNRRMTNEQIIRAIDIVNRHNMHSSVFIILGFPYETPANLYETVDILAQARPGRFRWTYFFPFPGTRAHELSVEGGFIDEAKMAQLVNFTDESCLDFGPEQNLLLRKIGAALPWFVNARLPGPVGQTCRKLTYELLALDEPAFAARASRLRDEDREHSQEFIKQGLTHYAVKYNRFMGVSSDYFLNEKS